MSQAVSVSVSLFWIYTTHTIAVCHLSPGQAISPYPSQHSTAQHSTEQLQPKRYPSISPASHPGITSSQSKQASTTYTTWATSRHCRPNQRITHTHPHEYQHRNLLPTQKEEQLCLSSRSRPTRIFRNIKANGRGESRAASVCLCLACQFCAHLHFVPAPCTIPAYARFSGGSDYRPAAGSTRAPVSQSADHSTSTHPSTIARSGSGTGLTDHRRSSTLRSVFGAEFLGATAREQ